MADNLTVGKAVNLSGESTVKEHPGLRSLRKHQLKMARGRRLEMLNEVRAFVERVHARADAELLRGGKAEGVHHRAMRDELAEMERAIDG